jgi:GcrA cell cycle regulator
MTLTTPPRIELLPNAAPTSTREDPVPFCWTDAAVARLRRSWANGRSAAQIARELGALSRSAVVAKARRLGLRRGAAAPEEKNNSAVPRCASPVGALTHAEKLLRQHERARVPQQTFAPARSAPQPGPMAQTAPASRPCSFMELGRDTCRWPVGDPGSAGFHFCGAPPDREHVYCAHHRGIAHERPDPLPEPRWRPGRLLQLAFGLAVGSNGTEGRGPHSWHMASAGYYREEAERHRRLAAAAPDSERAGRWLQLAAEYELLAQSMEPPAVRRVPMQQQPVQQQQQQKSEPEEK